jgi:hypothetical protein
VLEAILTIAGALVPVLALILKGVVQRKQAQREADEPILHQAEVDHELQTDKSAFAVRLSRLHEAIRQRRARPQ